MSYPTKEIAVQILSTGYPGYSGKYIIYPMVDPTDQAIYLPRSLTDYEEVHQTDLDYKTWLWESEYAVVSIEEALSGQVIGDNRPEGLKAPSLAPVTEIDATKYVITIKVDNVRDLAVVLSKLGLETLDRTDVNPA